MRRLHDTAATKKTTAGRDIAVAPTGKIQRFKLREMDAQEK
jgi:hypothetical protein